MAKSRNTDGDYMISETGNWNVADSFSKIKIMRLLGMADIFYGRTNVLQYSS